MAFLLIIGGYIVIKSIVTMDHEEEEEETVLENPSSLLIGYMEAVSQADYTKMYEMLSDQSKREISEEEFVDRNQKIYEGIEMQNMRVDVEKEEVQDDILVSVTYQTSFDTVAGEIQFENKANFMKEENRYGLIWDDALIFPDLWGSDKVRVVTTEAKRGRILDRNGKVLAGPGTASSVGIVPGKLEDKESSIAEIAELLDMDSETIEKKLSAKWVKEDSFVPLKTIPKVDEADLIGEEPEEDKIEEKQRQDQLLSISGVMISDVEVREYPLAEAAAHLIGYVQSVTAEDLEKHAGEGYLSSSVIGKSGIEALYEKELKGENGCEIYIQNESGDRKKVLASINKTDGEDIPLTIDSEIQSLLYEQFKEDKSCSVAMNPYTGEVLALVSTPSYDNNDFILGLSSSEWTELSENEDKPLYNRFKQLWCPGSTFKPIIGAIGLTTGAIDPNEDYGNVGLSWQKNAGWGNYHVTTLHTYEPVILKNALIYSDNIYFAKAALKIGEDDLISSLDKLGFNEEVPFELSLWESQYSNSDTFSSEIQLADSGYGQGEILVNPIHLASLYTAFSNNGDVLKPYLLYKDDAVKEIWLPKAFSEKVTEQIVEGLKEVVNNQHGTGYTAHREDIVLAGKTGTAEIKATKGDTSGTELGWFSVFTTDTKEENPIQIVSMVEDVKELGGSAYVVKKIKNVLDDYLPVDSEK